MRWHYTYCPKCNYFNDTCNCADSSPWNHPGIEHDNCEAPTNAWPKAEKLPEITTYRKLKVPS